MTKASGPRLLRQPYHRRSRRAPPTSADRAANNSSRSPVRTSALPPRGVLCLCLSMSVAGEGDGLDHPGNGPRLLPGVLPRTRPEDVAAPSTSRIHIRSTNPARRPSTYPGLSRCPRRSRPRRPRMPRPRRHRYRHPHEPSLDPHTVTSAGLVTVRKGSSLKALARSSTVGPTALTVWTRRGWTGRAIYWSATSIHKMPSLDSSAERGGRYSPSNTSEFSGSRPIGHESDARTRTLPSDGTSRWCLESTLTPPGSIGSSGSTRCSSAPARSLYKISSLSRFATSG